MLADGEVQLLGTGRPVAGAVPPSGPVVALVRPESLLVTADPAGTGRVVTRTFSGASTRVLVALPDGVEVRVDVASAASARPHARDGGHGDPGGPAGARRARGTADPGRSVDLVLVHLVHRLSAPVPDREHAVCVPAGPAQSGSS